MVADETWIYLDVTDGRLTIPAREIPEGSLIAAADGGSLSVDGSSQARGQYHRSYRIEYGVVRLRNLLPQIRVPARNE